MPPDELESLLSRAAQDASLGATLGRYAAIGPVLRGELTIASSSFCTRLMTALAQEPAPHASPGLSRSAAGAARGSDARPVRWPPTLMRTMRPLAGLAIAAGVATVAVLSVQRIGLVPEQIAAHAPPVVAESVSAKGLERTGEGAAAADTPAGEADAHLAGAIVTGAPDSYTVPDPESASLPAFVPATRLTNYVVAHSEYSSPLGRRSVLTAVLAEDDPGLTRIEHAEAAATRPQDP